MKRLGLGILLPALLLVPTALHAQVSAGGAILGTVTDQSGAVIEGAEVSVTNLATGQRQTAQTGSNGYFDFESLIASNYNLVILKPGFQKYTAENIKVDPGLRVQLNTQLTVGSETTAITVQGESVAVETASSEPGGTIQSKQIDNFALNGRNFTSLGLLVPGVNSTTGAQEQTGGGLTTSAPLSVNGVGREFTTYLQDGSFNMNTGCQCGLNIVSPIETIAEFRIVKDNFSAKFPLTGSGVVMVETKSGSNNFHGQAYEYLRNDKVDARNFFDGNTKAPLKQNIFGFEAQGPIFKNRTFFMVGEGWRRRHNGQTLQGAFPTQGMRSGDFSASPTLGKGGLVLDSTAKAIEAQLHPGVNCVTDSGHLNPACIRVHTIA